MSHLIVTFGGGSRVDHSVLQSVLTIASSASFSRSSRASAAWFKMPIASFTARTGYPMPLISFKASAVVTALLNDACVPLSKASSGIARSDHSRNAVCDSNGEVSLRLHRNDFNSSRAWDGICDA